MSLTLYLLVSSADNLCKQFGPRSGATFLSGSKLFDTLMVFPKDFFKKLILKKITRRQKLMQNYQVGKKLSSLYYSEDNFKKIS